jgi:signal transduction histidine kinase
MEITGWRNIISVSPGTKRNILLICAIFLLNFFFYSSWFHLIHLTSEPWLIFVWIYAVGALVPLAWRDKAPVIVFVIECILTAIAWPFVTYYVPVSGVPVALYAVAVHRSKKTSLLALLASAVPLGLNSAAQFKFYTEFQFQIRSFIATAVFLLIVTIAAWGTGRLTRASQLHVQQLERERETVREAVAAERTRIARELHDIVSHAVTAIVLQAAGASRVANTNFAQVTQSLANIEAMGKQAMAELRRLLDVLEASSPDNPAAGLDELGPQSGLADLPLLLTSLQDTGMLVIVHVEGTPRNLDPSIDLSAYRIVQEGLTNVLKHAGVNSHPQLRLVWEDRQLLIQIDNDVNKAAASRGAALSIGRGLVGLRARAHAAGGRLHAGPHHNGGYRLTATLPLPDPAQRRLSDTDIARTSSDGCGNQGMVLA